VCPPLAEPATTNEPSRGRYASPVGLRTPTSPEGIERTTPTGETPDTGPRTEPVAPAATTQSTLTARKPRIARRAATEIPKTCWRRPRRSIAFIPLIALRRRGGPRPASRRPRAARSSRFYRYRRGFSDDAPLREGWRFAKLCSPSWRSAHHDSRRRPAAPQELVAWPREESNLRTRIRSPSLYPLSYGAAGYEG
jgi:hypothetical protein